MANLSPAAQAVVDAFNSAARPEPHHQREAIAAALRAAADQCENLYDDYEGLVSVVRVEELLAIADELDPPSS